MNLVENQEPAAKSKGWRAATPSCQARRDPLGANQLLEEAVASSEPKGK